MKKGNLTVDGYILRMRTIVDSILAAGKSLLNEDLILYVHGGLGQEYENVIVNLTFRIDQLSLAELYLV